MDEVRLTVRLSVADRRALKLHAVAQGRSIRDLVTGAHPRRAGQGRAGARG